MDRELKDYQSLRSKLMGQLKRCRDREIRVKAELILTASKLGSVSLACSRQGFGRSFFYKWWRRLKQGKFKIACLHEKSRRPHFSPRKVSGLLEGRILHYRRKGYGARMIGEYLKREGRGPVSPQTIHHIINKRQPPTKKRVYKLKKHRKRYELVIPGQRLQMDVKYSPMHVGGKTVYIYVAVDECTRWRFARAYEELNDHWTADFLARLKKACPFPIISVQTDNGHEFTFAMLFGKHHRVHRMQEWCALHGITHRRIPPGVKELNGKVERSHRIDADYFYGRAPTGSIELFNAALERWIDHYNRERPHGGIGFMTPYEKLKERIVALKEPIADDTLEPLRLRFLAEGPRFPMTAREKLELLMKIGEDESGYRSAS